MVHADCNFIWQQKKFSSPSLYFLHNMRVSLCSCRLAVVIVVFLSFLPRIFHQSYFWPLSPLQVFLYLRIVCVFLDFRQLIIEYYFCLCIDSNFLLYTTNSSIMHHTRDPTHTHTHVAQLHGGFITALYLYLNLDFSSSSFIRHLNNAPFFLRICAYICKPFVASRLTIAVFILFLEFHY